MRKFGLNFPVCLLICIALFSMATAQYRSENWTTESGLPQNSVTVILQTKDGYIWLGTFGGLVRFDGIKFKIYNTTNAPAIKSNRIVGLFEDKNGTLWISTQYGDIVSYKDGIFTSVLERTKTSGIGFFCVDSGGAIWLRGGLGVQKLNPNGAGEYVIEKIDLPNEKDPHIGSIVEDDSGSIWISTDLGLYQYQNGVIQAFLYENIIPPSDFIKPVPGGVSAPGIFIDLKKRIWLPYNNGLLRFENGKFTPLIQKQDVGIFIAENIDGSFFVKSENNIYRFSDDKLRELLIDEPEKFNSMRDLMVDREGNLWVGTTGFGLLRYKQQTARTFGKADGLTDGGTFFAFEDRDKSLWVGADNLYKFRDGKFEKVPNNFNQSFVSAFQTKDGTLWFGIQGRGIVTYQNGKFTDFSKESGIVAEKVFEDSKGRLWFATNDGLITLHDGKREQFPFEIKNGGLQAYYEDREGRIWFATVSGLSCFKDGVFTDYTAKEGLSNDNVRDIYEDREGVLWFGTYGGGLNRFKDGKFFAITTNEGMNEDIVSRIIVDANDTFWLLGNRGVSVISRSALNDLADEKIKTIACASYDVSDGMKTSEGNGGGFPAGWLASDGRFWFPSINGVIAIEPKFNDAPPPPVFIEDVFLGGKQLASATEIEVAPDIGNLEIHYTGLNFTKPEQIKFKYKLEGFDSDWIEVGTRRAAYYTQIPAGHYRFLVTASTTSGVWNEQPAVKNVIVQSDPIWKKPLFILLGSLILISILIVSYRLRLFRLEKTRHQQQEFSRKLIESQEQERKRIAGELHDGLGQTLLIIKNRAFLGTKANDLDIANEQLGEISASSGEAINQAREIAYFLRPSQLERLGLTSALEEMISQVSESSEIEFECEIASIDDIFSPANEINFYRVVQESINNILKHSDATKAKVFVSRKFDKIELSVQDNGKGFLIQEKNIHGKLGFGLFGIEERVRILGGKFSMRSEISKGTKILVLIEKG